MKIICNGTGSKGNCIYVKFNNGACIYLDAGIQLRNITTPKSNAFVLVTHEHNDHAMFAKKWRKDYGARIVCSNGTSEACGFTYMETLKPSALFDELSYNTAESVREGAASAGSNFFVIGLRTLHDAKEPLAFAVFAGEESLFYCTDTGFIPDTHGFGFTVAIIEANYTPKRLSLSLAESGSKAIVAGRVSSGLGHLGLHHVEQWFNEVKDEDEKPKVFLAHLSENNFDEAEMADVGEEFRNHAEILRKGKEYAV